MVPLEVFYRVCEVGCATNCDSASIIVEFQISCSNPENYRLANVITPFDNNGQNDALVVTGIDTCSDQEVISLETSIVNRWGDLVWSSKNPNEFWEGRNQGGQELPEGTYYYHLKLLVPSHGIPISKTGYVDAVEVIQRISFFSLNG